jgi:hypothetical protein
VVLLLTEICLGIYYEVKEGELIDVAAPAVWGSYAVFALMCLLLTAQYKHAKGSD